MDQTGNQKGNYALCGMKKINKIITKPMWSNKIYMALKNFNIFFKKQETKTLKKEMRKKFIKVSQEEETKRYYLKLTWSKDFIENINKSKR